MKKNIIWVLLLALLQSFSITAYADEKDDPEGPYNPVSPPEPFEYYRVETSALPNYAGWTQPLVETYMAGEQVTVYAYEIENFEFEDWYEDGVALHENAEYTFTMPQHSRYLVACYNYKPKSPDGPMEEAYTRRVRIFYEPGNGGYANAEVHDARYFLMKDGETREIWAQPYDAFKFEGWKINGNFVKPNADGSVVNPLVLTVNGSNVDLVAKFSYAPTSPDDPWVNSYNWATNELIINHFSPGNLRGEIEEFLNYKNTGNIQYDDVESVIIGGRMEDYDYMFFKQDSWDSNSDPCMPNLVSIDLRPASNYRYINDNTFRNLQYLTTLYFPSSLEQVSKGAFRDTGSISLIFCYAPVPPQLSDWDANDGAETDRFEGFSYGADGVAEGAILYVPNSALSLYQEAPGWRHFYIKPIDNQGCLLTVHLPQDYTDGRYKNMYLELESRLNGQKVKYIVGEREEYVFQDLLESTSNLNFPYHISLKTKQGETVCSINDIVFLDEKEKEVYLTNPLSFHDFTVNVLTPDGKDVADEMDIVWTRANGEHLGAGKTLKKLIEGSEADVTVTLPETYGVVYKLPESVTVKSGKDSEIVTVKLEALPRLIAEGNVTDAGTGLPIADAYVAVRQLVSGKYQFTAVGKTDSAGAYRMEYIAQETSAGKVTCVAEGYVTQPCVVECFTDWDEMKNFEMKLISGSVVEVALNWYGAGADKPVEYSESGNVDFTLYNKTKGWKIANVSNQYPKLVILDDTDDGDQIEVTATSRMSYFEPVTSSTIIQNQSGKVVFDLIEHGKIEASIMGVDNNANNDRYAAFMLYDYKGDLQKATLFEDNLASFRNLEAGDYTVVAIMDSKYLNGVAHLNHYNEKYFLNETQHYLKENVKVEEGKISNVDFETVPVLPEENFYFTDPSSTSLSVNKTEVQASNYVTISARSTFKEEYQDIETLTMVFDIPEHCEYVEGSMIVGSEKGYPAYDSSNRTLTIEEVKAGSLIRFCLMPQKGEEFRPTASIEFTYNGETFNQSLGSVYFNGLDFQLFVPTKTSRDHVYARGVATPRSEVTVYAHGIPSGASYTAGTGFWVTDVPLTDLENNRVQQIYGEVLDPEKGSFPIASRLIEYDKYYPELQYVRMINQGFAIDFDHNRVKTSAKSYSYLPSADLFTLQAKFEENKDRVTKVTFRVKDTKGYERKIEGKYTLSKDSWVAVIGYPDTYRLPVNVTIDLEYSHPGADGTETPEGGDLVEHELGFLAPDVQPIIDPSGFVYEALESNRLGGVSVTVFYREGHENMYGEIEWVPTKWEAAEYGQDNPLLTDEEGLYGWDVPEGIWQVMYEKDGYETAYSDWLPVPPPQLEVNMGMIRNTNPEVMDVNAYSGQNGVEIAFDSYMDIASFENNVYIQVEGEKVYGTIVALDKDGEETSDAYASLIRYIPNQPIPDNYTQVQLTVDRKVRSYTGIELSETYSQIVDLEQEIVSVASNYTSAEPENIFELRSGEEQEMTIYATPGEAANGRILKIENSSPIILQFAENTEGLSIEEEGKVAFINLDSEGKAKIMLSGEISGQSELEFSIEGSNVKGKTKVKVLDEILRIPMPYASIMQPEVYRNQVIELICDYEREVEIYYTTDGSDPKISESRLIYKPGQGLTIDNDGVVIKTVAYFLNTYSDVATYTYNLKRSNLKLDLAEGWNWTGHNMENKVDAKSLFGTGLEKILSQDKELIRDEKLGLVGTLTELSASEGYKVKTSGASSLEMQDVSFNPATPIEISTGWTWIGYPVAKEMTLNEAFSLTDCNVGDQVVSQDGFAEYDGESWIGNLQKMSLGKSYLYYNVGIDKEITYPLDIVSKASFNSVKRIMRESGWVADINKYSSVMPMIAELITSGNEVASEDDYEVGAFCGTECRGVGTYVEGYIFMNIYGNIGDEISFRVLPKGAEESWQLTETLKFNELPEGSLTEPHPLYTVSSVKTLEHNNSDVKVSVLNGMIYVNCPQLELVNLFDTNGNKILTKRGADGESFSIAGVHPGIYIVAVENDHKWSYHKIMIK